MPRHIHAGEPGWEEYLEKSNARRRKRREDPAYKAMEVARQRASQAKRKAEAIETSRRGKAKQNGKKG